MRIVALTLCPDATAVREAVVRHNAEHVDLQTFACWPAASPGIHEVLRRCHAANLPVLPFDMPASMPCDASAVATLLSNLARFFTVDGIVLLTADERIAAAPGERLRARLARLPPAASGDAKVSVVEPSDSGRRRYGLGKRERCVLRPPIQSLDVEAWRQSLLRSSPAVGTLTLAPPRFGRSRLGASRRVPPRPAGTPTPPLTAAESGIWTAQLHRSNLYLDIPPFRFVADRHRPTSVLDVGCGVGGYVEAFRRWGAQDVLGVDGFELTGELLCPPDRYRRHDLSHPLDLRRTFDLVVSTEVAEHVGERHEEAFIDSIARHAERLILFSAARPGQPGVGHVNCKPFDHWLGLWKARGWVPSHFDTCAVRSLATFYWFRRNLVLLVRDTADRRQSREFAACPAGEVEIRRVRWVAQPPRVCEQSFGEPLPALDGAESDDGAGATREADD